MFKLKKSSIAAVALALSLALGTTGCGKVKDLTTEEKTTTVNAGTDSTTETETSTDETTTVEATESATEATTEETDEMAAEREKFDSYLDELFRNEVVSDTVTLHYTLAHPEEYGITDYEVTLGSAYCTTDEEFAEEKQEIVDEIAKLEETNYSYLDDDRKFIYDILYNKLTTELKGYDYPYLSEPFAYTSGLQTNYPITMSEYKFYDKQDVDDYLKLLELTPDYYESCLEFEKVKSDKGLFMSSTSAEEVVRQCSEFIQNPEENILIETFETRLDTLEDLTDEEKEAYIKSNEEAVMNYIIPTYENVIEVFTELKDTGKNELGLMYLDGGQEYYKYLMESKVGTSKTPEEIIECLDNAIEEQMNKLTSLAISNYSAYSSYFDDYDNLYGELDYKETIEYFENVCDEQFPDIPDIDFTVTPVHESLADSVSPAFFMTPPMDEYLENSIYINEGSSGSSSLWGTLAHEGVPGHMYQFVYFLSTNPNPIRTILSFNGYEEGWAQYVEYKSFQYYDGYKNSLYADFEELDNRLSLYVSARIEIGVNYEGWTLRETQDYLTEKGFDSSAAQDIMDYVIAEPGNYQMYCIGSLSFEELREKAEDALGNSFDEKEFHKVILDAGPCQFDLLEEKVDAYINNNK